MEISLPSGNCKRIINDKTVIVDDFEYTLLGTRWSKVRELSTEELSTLTLYDCHRNESTITVYAHWQPVYQFIAFSIVFASLVAFYQLIKRIL